MDAIENTLANESNLIIQNPNKIDRPYCTKLTLFVTSFAKQALFRVFRHRLLPDYLQHAPCMRRVQAGYEQCADTYQIQIKMLNENAATQRQQNVAATALANANGNGADGESAHPAATGTVIGLDMQIQFEAIRHELS